MGTKLSLPFARPHLPDFNKMTSRFRDAWQNGAVTKGPFTEQYESAVCAFTGTKAAVAVSSCTTGLILALQALQVEGECLVPAFTFTSTVQALLWNRLKPVFIDCHPRRFTIDLESLNASVTQNTGAVLVPYIFGNPPPFADLEAFGARKKLPLILDAAHAFGTLINGKHAGTHGIAEVFSTSATKLLCTGEGGMVTTGNPKFAETLRALREYGHGNNYETKAQGMNGRMTEFQSLMGLEGLSLLEDHAKHRNKLAALYREALAGLPVSFQEIEPGARSSYKDFALLLEPEWPKSRDETAKILEEEGIPTRKYFYPPIHRQPFFAKHAGALRQLLTTEKICAQILCLPIFYDLKESEIEEIGNVFKRIFNEGSRAR